jgi:acetyl-CoA carboxylase carboxyltransferase component
LLNIKKGAETGNYTQSMAITKPPKKVGNPNQKPSGRKMVSRIKATAEIAVMGAKGAAEIIFKNEIATSSDKETTWKEKELEYTNTFANPYKAAARGFIDEVILPEDTRTKLIKAFKMLENKVVNLPKKKHDNIPL